jgi:uncharacterized membrane protein YqjE
MAFEQREVRMAEGRINGRFRDVGEPPLRDLFRQLSEDAARLVRQEIALGKAEVRETVVSLGKDAVRIGTALGLGMLGAMAATAFAIVGLGALIGNYWLSALIVTVLLLAIGAIMGRSAMRQMRGRDLKPTQTLETLRADAEWAKHEARMVKQELTSDGSRSPVQM